MWHVLQADTQHCFSDSLCLELLAEELAAGTLLLWLGEAIQRCGDEAWTDALRAQLTCLSVCEAISFCGVKSQRASQLT